MVYIELVLESWTGIVEKSPWEGYFVLNKPTFGKKGLF